MMTGRRATSANSTGASRRIARVEGRGVEYIEAGVGTPVVLLHGVGESCDVWQWVLPHLAARFRVVAVSLPGFGASDASPCGFAVEAFQHATSGFLDGIGIERAVLIGNSIGGHVALRIALDTPQRVSALVLVDSAGLGRETNPLLIAGNLAGLAEGGLVWERAPAGIAARLSFDATLLFHRTDRVPREWLTYQTRLSLRPGFLEAALATRRTQLDAAGQREVLLDRLGELMMPVSIVWGAEDRIVPWWHGVEAHRRLPNGALHLIQDCGHYPHVERPADFLASVLPFLAATVVEGHRAAPGFVPEREAG